MTLVLALSGRIGAGKDTVADYLVRQHGFVKVSFADSLKNVVNVLYGIPLDVLYDPTRKNTPIPELGMVSPREIMREVASRLNSFYVAGLQPFVLHLKQRIETLINAGCQRIVISDLRTSEERNFLSNLNTICWIIERPNRVKYDDHITETSHESFGFDSKIINDGDLDMIYSKIDYALSRIL
jgi:hypothetical protein